MGEVTREEMKEQAIIRMQGLGIPEPVINNFKEQDHITVCNRGRFEKTGVDLLPLIHAIERKYGGLVYMVVRAESIYGYLDSLLYISPYEEDWEDEDDAIRDGIVFSYTHNWDFPECSEFGSIVVTTEPDGCLLRIA